MKKKEKGYDSFEQNVTLFSCFIRLSSDKLYLIEFSAQSDHFTDIHVDLKV